jgi:choline dehydrogenase-like flavoprotein
MPYSQCVRCATCDGFPCLVHAKSDAEVLGVRPALEHPNVTLLTNARATKIETDSSGGRVTEVLVERGGETERFAGDIVVVACGAANLSPRRPATAPERARQRLGSGGRNCIYDHHARALRESHDRLPNPRGSTTSASGATTSSSEHQMVGKSSAEMFRGEKPGETRLAPEWTLDRVARHAIDFWLSTEDLPRPDNRVTLEPDGNIKLTYSETSAEAKKRLYGKLKSLLPKLNMNEGHLIHRFAYMKNDIPVAGVAHQAGTCRFGTDPDQSVLDRDCKAHELDNLYVVHEHLRHRRRESALTAWRTRSGGETDSRRMGWDNRCPRLGRRC